VSYVDRARAVRPGEELDAAKLGAFLGIAEPLEILQFPGGHSNLTYLVRAGERELVVRRPPFGNRVKSAHDMGREYRILEKLCRVYAPAPKPVAYSEDLAIMGAPFYVMERVRGVILRNQPPPGMTLDAGTMRELSDAFIDNLVALHRVDYAAAGLAELGKPGGYIERQVAGWTKRYRDAKTDDVPEVEYVASWLAERTADAEREAGGAIRAAIIHNDYKFDNLVLDPDRVTQIRGVLDWEMSTLGDPLMDLGTALSYWVEAGDPPAMQALAFGPTMLPGALTRRELAARYFEKSGLSPRDVRFFVAFAHFKNVGVIQQIYYRYKQGLTKDERFASFGMLVALLAQRAKEATVGEG
jgi:aminoglycoside phosphotransferase (APT) family kinase protein